MSKWEIMISALHKHIIPKIYNAGFSGKYPHFRKECNNYVELISFQTNKYGGSFTIEVSAVFPNTQYPNYIPYKDMADHYLRVDATNIRYRLPGLYDGWFYYSDVYRKRTLFYGNVYYNTMQNDNTTDIFSKGYRLVQKFDDNAAEQICKEIDRQMLNARRWLDHFEKKQLNRINRYNKTRQDT